MNSNLDQMRRQIEADGRASQALRDLHKQGLDIESVLNGLFLFCGGSAEEAREGLATAKESRDRFINCADRAEQLANEMERNRPEMEALLGYQRHTLDDLPALLRDEADWIRRIVRATVGPYLDDVRMGGKTKRGKKAGEAPLESKVNITAGRDQHLVYLAYLVGLGEEPTTDDLVLLASLIRVLLKDENPPSLMVDRLRHKLYRFSRRFAEDAQTIKASVQDELEDLSERTTTFL